VIAVLLRHLTRSASSHPILWLWVCEKIFLSQANALVLAFFDDKGAYHFSDNLYCKILIFFQNLRHYQCDFLGANYLVVRNLQGSDTSLRAETLSLRVSPMPCDTISI